MTHTWHSFFLLCAALAAALSSTPLLTNLAVADCGILDKGFVALSEALRSVPLLRSLSLSSNSAGPEGGAALAAALAAGAAPLLETLDLQGNAVCGSAVSPALAAACTSLPFLTSLNLRKTWCGDIFVAALVPGLLRLRLLENLNLGANAIGPEGSRALVSWLSSPGAAPLLVTLGLRDSGIGEEGERAVAAVWPATK